MRIWSIALIALCLLGVHPAKALPDYGPTEDLFDFAGFEWMADGVWLCWDSCDMDNDQLLYVVAEPSAGRIDVYSVGPAEGIASDEPEGAAADCTVIAGMFTGRIYATKDQDHSFIFAIEDTAGFSTPLFLLLDFTDFTDSPGSGLYFSEIREGPALNPRQIDLLELLEEGDLSVLDTEDWTEIWRKFQKAAAQDVAQFRTVGDRVFERLDHRGRTSPALKRSLMQKAILSGAFILFYGPEISWAEIRDNCLDPADLEPWG